MFVVGIHVVTDILAAYVNITAAQSVDIIAAESVDISAAESVNISAAETVDITPAECVDAALLLLLLSVALLMFVLMPSSSLLLIKVMLLLPLQLIKCLDDDHHWTKVKRKPSLMPLTPFSRNNFYAHVVRVDGLCYKILYMFLLSFLQC